MSLTDTKVRNAKPQEKPYQLQDGNGLYLDVRPSGVKVWRYRYWLTPKKDGRYTIGEYPSISLSDARKIREWAREQVKSGSSPKDVKDREKKIKAAQNANTFQLVAEEWISRKSPTWKPATGTQIHNFLSKNVYPVLGDTPIRDITAHDILSILREMENRGAATSALKIRQWCSAIFCYAVSTLRADHDPASPLKGAIIRPKVIHSKPLTDEQLISIFTKLSTYKGSRATQIALLMIIYTFVRTTEIRHAEWSEFDLDGKLWVIPETKMKMGKKHVIPLSEPVIKLLTELRDITGGGRWLFPNSRRPYDVINRMTLNRAIEYLGFQSGDITAHDFRATASTRLHEVGYKHDVIERQLAHTETNSAVAAYNHAEYLSERAEMMEYWAGHINDVVGLR